MAGYDYVEFATGGASLDEKLPIVFLFHCRGCEPKGIMGQLESLSSRARVVIPRARTVGSDSPVWFDHKAVTEDQKGLADQMRSEAKSMVKFIRTANRCLMGVGAPVVAGHSQGGLLTLAVAAEAPRLVKAAVPASGWLPADLWPNSLPPTVAVHGEIDTVVEYARTADFVARAQASGLPIELLTIPDHGHGLREELKRVWVELVDYAIER